MTEECERCGGSGKILYKPTSVGTIESCPCPDCRGTGKAIKRNQNPKKITRRLKEPLFC